MKKKLKKMLGWILALSLIVTMLEACSSSNKTAKTADKTTTTSTSEEQEEFDIQQIGQDGFGYVSVPSDWIRFRDVGGGGETYQYTAPDAYTIVTLFSYDKETLGVQEINDAAAETAADRYAYALDSAGTFEGLTGAKTKIADYEAYQVYATNKNDGKMVCAWIFVTEEKDKVYLVSLEGDLDSETYLNALGLIEVSWSATKK